MLRFVLALLLLMGLFGCQSMPAPGWHNPNKPVSDFDYDFYNCRMMVLQTTPQPQPPQASPVANAVYEQCTTYGNVQQCWQQQVPIYADQTQSPPQPPAPDPAWIGKIETLTNECVARQGWVHVEAPPPVAGQ